MKDDVDKVIKSKYPALADLYHFIGPRAMLSFGSVPRELLIVADSPKDPAFEQAMIKLWKYIND